MVMKNVRTKDYLGCRKGRVWLAISYGKGIKDIIRSSAWTDERNGYGTVSYSVSRNRNWGISISVVPNGDMIGAECPGRTFKPSIFRERMATRTAFNHKVPYERGYVNCFGLSQSSSRRSWFYFLTRKFGFGSSKPRIPTLIHEHQKTRNHHGKAGTGIGFSYCLRN